MYYIYNIAYKVSDQITAQKEAEKPFWWEHLHPSVKEQSIEEIEKTLLEGGIPAEKLAEMTRHEKYMAVSEGNYCVECTKINSEIESLKQNAGKTSVLDNANPNPTPAINDEPNIEPIAFGKKPEEQTDGLEPGGTDGLTGATPTPSPLDDSVKDVPGAANGSAVTGGGSPEDIRKYTQSIVSKTIGDINSKIDHVPESVNEQQLLQSVIEELQIIKNNH